MKSQKRSIILIICIAVTVTIGLLIGEFFILKIQFETEISSEKAAYDIAKTKYESAYKELIHKQEDWSNTVDKLNQELTKVKEAYAETSNILDEIYKQQELQKEQENQRWESLSDEEKEAELAMMKNNEMVSYLRSFNEEYNNIYIKLCGYIGKDYSKLSKQEKKDYYELATKKEQIEADYLDNESR